MKSQIVYVTPEIARHYLSLNTANYRTIKPAVASRYAEDMKSGNWHENGEAIQFSKNGTLKNGQHRLLAIVNSGVSMEMNVVTDLDDDVEIFDWGSARSNAQIAKARGLSLGTDAIGAARIILAGYGLSAPKGITDKYLTDHYDQLREASVITRKNGSVAGMGKIGKKAGCCLAVYIARRLDLVNDAILVEFFGIFNSMNILPEQKRNPGPPLVASRMIVSNRLKGSGHGQESHYSITIQALLDYKKNKARSRNYDFNADAPKQYLEKIREMDGITKQSK